VLSSILVILVAASFSLDRFDAYPEPVGGEIQFAAHGPRYVTAGYHLLALPLFLTAIFVRKFWAPLVLTLIYLGIHIYSLWIRTQGCFLGEVICPPAKPLDKLLERALWIDGAATLILSILVIFLLFQMLSVKRSEMR